MPETISDKRTFSLLEVCLSIQNTLAGRYKSVFWVKAEMNKLNHYSYSGHCYPELVEKKDGKIVAQLRSVLWKTDFLRINAEFLRVLKEPLKDGIQILFCASISFDPVHGLSLRMIDIDPSWSLGELEREKQQTIQRLQQEGIFNNNRLLQLALVPQRIAVISVETSKGLADFLKVLNGNPWNYRFFHFLFPALLQGDQSVDAIIRQLQRIKRVAGHFDLVAIIRGGGGDVGLSSYNHYRLAREIALFPLPVFTGIGHATNETVAEMVAFKNAITPTELADFLLQAMHDFSIPVQQAEEKIIAMARQMLRDEHMGFHTATRHFRSAAVNLLKHNNQVLAATAKELAGQAGFLFRREKLVQAQLLAGIRKGTTVLQRRQNEMLQRLSAQLHKESLAVLQRRQTELHAHEQTVNLLNPLHVLKRGFAIALHNGKAVKTIAGMSEGDELAIIVADGSLDVTVNAAKKKEDI